MSAQVDTNISGNQSDFEFLNNAFMEDRNAVQKQETGEMDVGEQAGDGEGVDGRSEGKQSPTNTEKELKKIRFKKGEQVWDIDEDAIAEIKADKSTRSLSAKQMRDKASGEIAIENRMRELAEKKKESDSFIKNFSKLSKSDPLRALEGLIEYASQSDPDLKFEKFINELAKQGESLEGMSESERRAWELDRKLKQKEEILQEKESKERLIELRDDFVEDTGISHETFDQYAQALLEDPILSQHIKNEDDLLSAMDNFNYEVAAQNAAYAAVKRVQPSISADDPIIVELAGFLKQNPEWTPEDVLDVTTKMFGEYRKGKAARTLSRKQRVTVSDDDYESANLSDFEFLERELLKDREKKRQQ